MQDIMSNKKQALQRTQTKRFKIPLLPELGVTYQWNEAMKLPGFADFMPKEWTSPK